MESDVLSFGDRTLVSLFAAVTEDGLRPGPVLDLAQGAAALSLTDLGPALAAAGLAYAGAPARHAASTLVGAIAASFAGPVSLDAPDDASAALGAEACGIAPLPTLVLADDAGRRLSRVVALSVPPELFAAARIWLLGHGELPSWLALAPADRAAITAALPRATSLAHAAALAGRLAAIAGLDPDRRAEADLFIFGEPRPPRFLPEATAAALVPGADGAAMAAMAGAVAPHLVAPPFCPAPLAPLLARRRRPVTAPVPLSLFPELAVRPGLRAVS
ncbi:MAG: hypothetical protein IT556_11755 [Acetobacteraceae bacterium]|nr:hypothetical protein [Acetobacteraceae bacterium]